MFITALFTIAKQWSQTRCPSTNDWIKEMWHIYMIEYYSAIKKNELILFVGKWMETEIIMLNKINQTKKDKYCMFSFICRIYT
jgi:hypothetical protein